MRDARTVFEKGTLVALACAIVALTAVATSVHAGKPTEAFRPVNIVRTPNGGIQPQVAVDDKGVLHIVYFIGDAAHGDLYYVRSADHGGTFSSPVKVNSHPGSAMATGNIRGAHLAIGRNQRVFVAWNGTYELGRPGITKPWMKHPMLVARLNDDRNAFEAERNVIQSAWGLDGGGAIAADAEGDVYVFWHAPTPGSEGEANRRIWVARSTDDGKTFAPEKAAFDTPTGACGCCGMSAFAGSNSDVYVLYRSATEMVHRDIYLLHSSNRGETFRGTDIAPWNIGACTMSMENLSQGANGILAGWETMGNVFYGVIDPATGRMSSPVAAPGEANGRKYPSVSGNRRGETLLTWADGMKWAKGGSISWQLFDRNGQPQGAMGHAGGVPAWSLVASFARPDGGFTLVY